MKEPSPECKKLEVGITGDYNLDQKNSFEAIDRVLGRLSAPEVEDLRARVRPYLEFRRRLDLFTSELFHDYCAGTCFQTGLSACCGFESIITFFADQVIALLYSSEADRAALFSALRRPNRTTNCVFLGADGCLWKIRPISCAMYFCDDAKTAILSETGSWALQFKRFKEEEKSYTQPVRPVLFNDLEKDFMRLGVRSPYMWFHRSPGLIRLKQRFGVE